MNNISAQLELDYNAVGVQVRLPFVKGYSVYVPFKKYLKNGDMNILLIYMALNTI